jgi:hypothetical protein
MDFREAWACSDRTEADGLRVHTLRVLDTNGRQLRASVQWGADNAHAGQLRLWGISDVEGAADPAIFREIDVSSDTNQNNPEAPGWSLRLGENGSNRSAVTLPFSEAPVGATLRWRQVEKQLRGGQGAMLTLSDRSGAVLATRSNSADWFQVLEQRLRQSLHRSKLLARDPSAACEPVTEWMRL